MSGTTTKIKTTEKQITVTVTVDAGYRDHGYYHIDEALTSRTQIGESVVDEKCIGKVYALAEVHNLNSDVYHICITEDADTIAMGWPGNSNPKIRSHYGWRGTTDNRYFSALGPSKLISYKQHPNTYRTVLVFERLEPTENN